MIQVYCANTRNQENFRNSSSGGMYHEFAQYIISQGGVAYGVVFNLDKLQGEYSRAETIDQVMPQRQSKYCSVDLSNLKQMFMQVKSDLECGKQVLFSCVPCVGMVLKQFLSKEYSNLYIYCLICSGYNIDINALIADFRQKLWINGILTNVEFRKNKRNLNLQFKEKGCFTDYNVPYWSEHVQQFLDINKKCRPCSYLDIYDKGIFDICAGDVRPTQNIENRSLRSRLILNEHGQSLFDQIMNSIDYEKIKQPNEYFFQW